MHFPRKQPQRGLRTFSCFRFFGAARSYCGRNRRNKNCCFRGSLQIWGEIGEIKTAVSEAVTNCIVHGYRGRANGSIELVGRILEDNVLYIKIRDKGCGIEDVKQAMEPLYTSAPEEERAGLGFAVMESFMDRVTVRSAPNKGTSVIMTRKIPLKSDDT